MPTDISQEPLENLIAENLGLKKAWKHVLVDSSGNVLLSESLSWEIRWDYGSRTDGQPEYVGYAKAGTAVGTVAWLLHKFTYTTVGDNDFVSRREVATGNWANRDTYF